MGETMKKHLFSVVPRTPQDFATSDVGHERDKKKCSWINGAWTKQWPLNRWQWRHSLHPATNLSKVFFSTSSLLYSILLWAFLFSASPFWWVNIKTFFVLSSPPLRYLTSPMLFASYLFFHAKRAIQKSLFVGNVISLVSQVRGATALWSGLRFWKG